jgi:hypothetical protein
LLLDVDGVSGEADVVIGGKERDQAESQATNGFRQPQLIQTQRAKTQRAKTQGAKTQGVKNRAGGR